MRRTQKAVGKSEYLSIPTGCKDGVQGLINGEKESDQKVISNPEWRDFKNGIPCTTF